jgi:phosphoglycolate phosphatase
VQAPDQSAFKAALLDLDGTLIDHFRVIYRCYQYALQKLDLEPVTYEKVRASVGGSIVITFGKLIPEEHVQEAVGYFREEFDRIWDEEIEILPGTEWLLDNLRARGLKMAVFTNKEGDRARRILDHIGLSSHLDAVYGTLDTPWRKPQPEFTHHVLKELGADARHACMIGDSPYDVDAAAVAGMPCYTVATGSHSVDQLRRETRSAGVYPDLHQLGQAVFGLDPAPSRHA